MFRSLLALLIFTTSLFSAPSTNAVCEATRGIANGLKVFEASEMQRVQGKKRTIYLGDDFPKLQEIIQASDAKLIHKPIREKWDKLTPQQQKMQPRLWDKLENFQADLAKTYNVPPAKAGKELEVFRWVSDPRQRTPLNFPIGFALEKAANSESATAAMMYLTAASVELERRYNAAKTTGEKNEEALKKDAVYLIQIVPKNDLESVKKLPLEKQYDHYWSVIKGKQLDKKPLGDSEQRFFKLYPDVSEFWDIKKARQLLEKVKVLAEKGILTHHAPARRSGSAVY